MDIMQNRNKWISVSLMVFLCGLVSNMEGQQLPVGAVDPSSEQENGKLTLWYEQPANKWVEALPIGNGRLGAMIFGGTKEERLQLNEDTLWNGQPHDYAHEGAVRYLPAIRDLLAEGKQRQAEALAMEQFMSVPLRQKAYQPLGDLLLDFPGHNEVQNYRRQLDLASAVATVTYKVGDVTYKREIFSSAPDQVIVLRITADKKGAINFRATMRSPHAGSILHVLSKDQLALRGQIEDGVVTFEARLAVRTDGGQVEITDKGVEIVDADSATLLLAAAGSVKNYKDVSADPAELCSQVIQTLQHKMYDAIRKDHIADYRQLFSRVSLDLGITESASLPTDQRIKAFSEGKDPHLAVLYFQFGRYLMIAGSRPGCQPLNLQGIWNESKTPPWDSKYTTNINAEMNYWPAESCNLAECHLPLFDLIKDVSQTGERVAKEHYNCRGWVLHHNTDMWRGTAPINASDHGIWVTGGAWLCQHLWWHYEFSSDEQFLREQAYPIMKGAALFFVDFLTPDPKTGWLISTPSNSPENGGLVAGPTMDHQIIRNLFSNCIAASRKLNVDADLREKLEQMKEKIAPNQIGRHGQLQEWLEDKDDPKNTHRHVSHLWGVCPGEEITLRGTPKLSAAAKQSLIFRGDGGMGWSKAWKINLWARFEDGDHAYKMLSILISTGTYPNMFDDCPPFQIDGNFGGISGIAEMFLQSHTGKIHLLPALPGAWPDGSLQGLCARGAFVVDLKWKNNTLSQATIYSKKGNPCKVTYKDKTIDIPTTAGQRYVLNSLLELNPQK